MRFAAIDIGTNSVKLLVADRKPSGLREVLTRVAVTRLGEGMGRQKKLRLDAMERTLEAIAEFRGNAEQKEARRVFLVGTEALRRARNSREFVLRCEYEVGLLLRILTPEQEARLSFLGGTSGMTDGAVVAVDIGGGSTEFMMGVDGKFAFSWSLPLGVVVLSERWMKKDPPSVTSLVGMKEAAEKQVRMIPRYRGEARFVAIGGTASSLVKMHLKKTKISGPRIHGRKCSLDTAHKLLRRLSAMSLERRRKVPGLEPARADVILAGLTILVAAAERLGLDRIHSSARGLRHGVLLAES